MRSNQLFATFDDMPNPVHVRAAAAAGRFVIRWDARTTTVIPIEPPRVDEEAARLNLAHRYASSFGPSGGATRFARWAGVDLSDATTTWEKLNLSNQQRGASRVVGVRHLPFGDPYLYGRRPATSPAREIPSVILVDGRRAATWARQRLNVTIHPTTRLSATKLDRIVAAAHELARPLGAPVRVTVA